MGALNCGQGSSHSCHTRLISNNADIFLPVYLFSMALFH